MKTIKQIREASGGKEAYQKFFNSLLKKFGVSSPSELDGKKKKDFFDAIDKGWEGDNEKAESVKEAKKLRGGKGKAEIDINFDGSAKDIKFASTKYKIKFKTHSNGAIITGDKQKILAYLQGQDYAMDDEDIEDLYPEVLETYDDPDNLDPDSTLNPDEVPFAKKKGKGPHDGKTESKDFSQAQEVTEKDTLAERGKEAKLSSAQLKKAEKIAKKHSGDMEKAMAEIEKIKKGSSESDAVMAILKKANEGKYYEVGTDEYRKHTKKMTPGEKNEMDEDMCPKCGEDHVGECHHEAVTTDARLLGFKSALKRKEGAKQKGKVIVDRRTRGYREAEIRRAAYVAKKEEKRKAKEFAEKYPKIDYNYAKASELEKVIAKSHSAIMGETAANAVSAGGVDMAPNTAKKKKDKEKLMARRGY